MQRNRDFKIKLINPCHFDNYSPFSFGKLIKRLPYGMAILTAFLREHNYYVEQEDLSARFNCNNYGLYFDRYYNDLPIYISTGRATGRLDTFADKVLDSTNLEGFNLIGFSIFSRLSFFLTLLISKKIKERTDIPIVFGGPFITLFGHLYPEIFNFINYMIIGDGGAPLLRLIDYLRNKISLSEVPNLVYKEDGQLKIQPIKHYSLEEISPPDFDGLSLNLYKNSAFKDNIVLPYQITRGCIGRCSFCSNIHINKRLEFKSYDKVIAELRQMKERYKSNMFDFCDDAINNSYEYLERLCNLFIKNKLEIYWNVYARIGNLDKYILRKMKEAGCHKLKFGIESGSERMLKMMYKGFTLEQTAKTLRDAAETGIKNFIS